MSAPLPFQGQKRMFAKQYMKVLQNYPDGTTFVDLFGGSGLLSHITKYHKPNSIVVYNDYDNYRKRLEHIPKTNELLAELQTIVIDIPRNNRIIGKERACILECLKRHLEGYDYLDFVTISANILFSMKYCVSMEEIEKETFYNRLRTTEYPNSKDYLEGITITSCDYRKVFEQYKNVPGVVFLVDPPYLNTDTSTYNMYWKLSDYLDVLTVLAGHSFIYFTSNKSSILELCDWIGKNKAVGNPFKNCHKVEFNAHMNYNTAYTDIMLYSNTI